MKITFIGLGTMGYHMAGHLATKLSGLHDVSVYNRSNEKSQKWQENFTGKACSNVADAVKNADIIMLCLGRDEDVLSVVEHADFINNIKAGAIIVDHTTTSHKLCETLVKSFAKAQAHFVDAPVSGGESGAINGALSSMIGGEAEHVQFIEPFLATYCSKQTHMGKAGNGQLAKMVNQICICGVLKGLSEGIKFAENENLDIDALLAAISGGAAQSWQMQNRGKTMHNREFDFGFAIKWMIKDLGYCLERGEVNDTTLENTQKVYEQYAALEQKGHERSDTSSLILSQDIK